jgi:prophage regulatory protein
MSKVHHSTVSQLSEQCSPPRLCRMYRLKELPAFVGLQRTVISEMIKRGEFPAPISLNDSGRAVAWLETDLRQWQMSRIALRNARTP